MKVDTKRIVRFFSVAIVTTDSLVCSLTLSLPKVSWTPSVALYAVKKGKKQTVASAAGLKGFGAVVSTLTTSNDMQIEIDRSKETLSFYESTLQQSTVAGENLKRTALAYTSSITGGELLANESINCKLRGVVTTRDVAKGNDLISIPYEMAIDLGPEGNDPTIPAITFLKDYCSVLRMNYVNDTNLSSDDPTERRKLHCYRMLPTYDSDDCRGCTNFFSNDALEALQCPYIVHETNQQKRQIQQRYEHEVLISSQQEDKDAPETSSSSSWMWIDGITPISIEHLTWAVWIITSRVLTVQTGHNNNDDGPIQYRRLLIPYLDMCNHDRTSTHILTGRATRGGLLRIVAGSSMKSGTPVEICYGGGVSGNDRFIQEYGFLDTNVDAYKLVALDLLGQKRRGGSGGDNSYRSLQDRNDCLHALRATTIKDDEASLIDLQKRDEAGTKSSDPNMKVAIQYRIGIKKTLQEISGEQW